MMLAKISTPFLLLLLAALYNPAAAQCVWQGTAPACAGECPSTYPKRVAVGKGGCDNGSYCVTGQKVLCCPQSFQRENCEWYGTAPFCGGECPPGKSKLSVTDSGGDGSTCATGCKVFCCDGSSTTEGIRSTACAANDPALPTVAKAGHLNVGQNLKHVDL